MFNYRNIPPQLLNRKRRKQKQVKSRRSTFAKSAYGKWSYVWGIVGPLLTLLFFYFNNYPKIDIEFDYSEKILNPFVLPFKIHNKNSYTIYNVKPVIRIFVTRSQSNRFIFYNPLQIKSFDIAPKINPNGHSIILFSLTDSLSKYEEDVGNILEIENITFDIELSFKPLQIYGNKFDCSFEFLYHKDNKGQVWCHRL